MFRRMNMKRIGPISAATFLLVAGVVIAVTLSAQRGRAEAALPAPDAGAPTAQATGALSTIANQVVQANGNAPTTFRRAVVVPRAAAYAAVDQALPIARPGEIGYRDPDELVYLVLMRGHFIARSAKIPPGSPIPQGSDAFVIVTPTTGEIEGWGVSPKEITPSVMTAGADLQ